MIAAIGLEEGGLQLVGDIVRGGGGGMLLILGPLILRGMGSLLKTSDLRLLSAACFN
jgi:hypothetical protein